ncbi:hypothetical protein [Citrobacter phage Ci1]|nr:hypothetical protein [Citrobacter phage Ci1]
MKLFVIRGVTVAELEINEPRQCISIPPINIIPKEILTNADFIFHIEKDQTVTFIKKRSEGKNKHFFNLDLALRHIRRHYSMGNLDLALESFEKWDLTNLSSVEDLMERSKFYVKQLREGVYGY